MKPPADVVAWHELHEQLTDLKARELQARQKVIAKYFADAKGDGTKTTDLGRGFTLAATFRTSYSLDPDKAREAQDKIAAQGDLGVELATRVVRWKPELRVGEFKKLPPAFERIIRKALTISSGTPSLELREPKAKAA